MDAWETLFAGSTLASGDAWEHLNAQGGGAPPGDITIILASGITASVSTLPLSGVIDEKVLSASVPSGITASISIEAVTANISPITLSGAITSGILTGGL